jgi:hypothetical protein
LTVFSTLVAGHRFAVGAWPRALRSVARGPGDYRVPLGGGGALATFIAGMLAGSVGGKLNQICIGRGGRSARPGVGGHGKLPMRGQLGARWRSLELPADGHGICPTCCSPCAYGVWGPSSWVPEPGMWFQYDFGTGPRIAGVATWLSCAWLAWCRFGAQSYTVVVPAPALPASTDVSL